MPEASLVAQPNASAPVAVVEVEYYTCPLLVGYPSFIQILNHASYLETILILVNLLLVTTCLLFLVQEGMVMYRYFRKFSNFDRYQRKLIFLQATLPFALNFSALIISITPRLHSLVNAFISMYFAFCIQGKSRMIFGFFGGVRKTSEFLTNKQVKIEFNAVPLTCCLPCLPKVVPSIKNLNLLRFLIMQVVPVILITTFLSPAIILDGSLCVKGQFLVEGAVTSPILIITIFDLVSTMIAITALGCLAKITVPFLEEKYKMKERMTVFRLCLLFFRVQPAIFLLCKDLLAGLKPILPFYSNEAYAIWVKGWGFWSNQSPNSINFLALGLKNNLFPISQVQIFEFTLLAIWLKILYQKIYKTQLFMIGEQILQNEDSKL